MRLFWTVRTVGSVASRTQQKINGCYSETNLCMVSYHSTSIKWFFYYKCLFSQEVKKPKGMLHSSGGAAPTGSGFSPITKYLVLSTPQKVTALGREARRGGICDLKRKDLWATVSAPSILSFITLQLCVCSRSIFMRKVIQGLKRQLKAVSARPCCGWNVCLQIHTVKLNPQWDDRKMRKFGEEMRLWRPPQEWS